MLKEHFKGGLGGGGGGEHGAIYPVSFKFIRKLKNLAKKRDWPTGSES